jgi:hypothetical protein
MGRVEVTKGVGRDLLRNPSAQLRLANRLADHGFMQVVAPDDTGEGVG